MLPLLALRRLSWAPDKADLLAGVLTHHKEVYIGKSLSRESSSESLLIYLFELCNEARFLNFVLQDRSCPSMLSLTQS